MSTVTKTELTRSTELKEALKDPNLDTAIKNVKKLDNTCSFTKCKTKTSDFAVTCKYCAGRFCTTHCMPEIHGCGEAVRRDERRQFLHPTPKLTEEKHDKASTKLTMKLKQMQQERKAKAPGTKSKKK